MSIFANLKTKEGVAEETDRIGGSRVLESDVYDFTVDMAYIAFSQGGAMSLNLTLKGSNGENLKEAIWVASGDAKGNKNTFTDKQGKEQYLPGFNMGNAISLLTVGKEIGDLDPEEKTINIYNFEAKKEVPTKVPVLVEMLGEKITLGVLKVISDKNIKDDSGKYVPSGETREGNEIAKAFHGDTQMTVAEIRAESSEATFVNTWREKNKGNTRDKSTGASGSTGTTGAPTGAAAPKKSLFK